VIRRDPVLPSRSGRNDTLSGENLDCDMNDGLFKAPPRAVEFSFSGNPLDRRSDTREDAQFMDDMAARPDALSVAICRDTPILAQGNPLFALRDAERLSAHRERAFLGVQADGAPVFATRLDDSAVELRADASDGFFDRRVLVPGRDDLALVDLRSLAMQGALAPYLIAILGQAKAVMHWHATHRFCANCGAPTRISAAGWRRECDVCKAQHFPRTDPVVIMLAVSGDSCLMGRQAGFPQGMYSCLAGFLEPGESIEEAVRREIFEEAGVHCGAVSYLASQPWPFPASLMIGCLARATTRELRVDGIELEDARWFTREECVAMLAGRHADGLSAPRSMAIANHILRAWAEG
jgi:NAD+ diphosphatase